MDCAVLTGVVVYPAVDDGDWLLVAFVVLPSGVVDVAVPAVGHVLGLLAHFLLCLFNGDVVVVFDANLPRPVQDITDGCALFVLAPAICVRLLLQV